MQGVPVPGMDRTHSQIPYDQVVPEQNRRPAGHMGMGMGMDNFGGGPGDSLGTEQAMISKVIEDSLKQ